MSFQPGDLVVIVHVEGATYPPDAQPGITATIEQRCHCMLEFPSGQAHWTIAIATRSLCAPQSVLRRIDPEPRQVVKWDSVPWQPERTAA